MTNQSIPERQPIAERVTGVVTRFADGVLLSRQDLKDGEAIARGEIRRSIWHNLPGQTAAIDSAGSWLLRITARCWSARKLGSS